MTHAIKQIHYSLYTLIPKIILNAKTQNSPRQGALLRVDFGNEIGYADCFPWEELGDASLSEQLQTLAKNKLTPLTKKSLYFARIDAQYRAQNKSVFLNEFTLKNHLIASYEKITSLEILKTKSQGFDFLKVKCGKNISSEIEFIKNHYLIFKENGLKLRLDFNSSINKEQAKKFFLEIKDQLNIIDFVEDPCPFNIQDWQELQSDYHVNLALDRKTEEDVLVLKKITVNSPNVFNVIILKPAIDDIDYYYTQIPKQRIVFTSYMDHPFGQMCALYEAQNFYKRFPEKREPCGFLTHQLYEPNSYSNQLKVEGTTLLGNPEPGFGFKNLLENECWIAV